MRFEQADSIQRDGVVHADICIAGGGPAGIALARSLANGPVSIVVVESGVTDFEAANQALAEGTSTGDPYDVGTTRARRLGGATSHWAGWCRPLDAQDLAARAWMAHSGWPFGREVLDPYYEQARPLCRLTDGPFELGPLLAHPTAGVEAMIVNDVVTTAVYRLSPGPVHFGEEYRGDLEQADNIRVILEANVVDIAADGSQSHVEHYKIATLAGNRFSVAAKFFVLALGGIENARLLLASAPAGGVGLGNRHDLVGRYFLDHPEVTAATIVCSGRVPPNYLGGRPDYVRTVLAFTPEFLAEHELPATSFVFEPYPWDQSTDTDTRVSPTDVAAVLRAVEGGESLPYSFAMRCEPEANPDSRVTLGQARDQLGMPRVQLHWRLGPHDRARFRTSLDEMARELGIRGVGWLRREPTSFGAENETYFYGAHHMGTTRMSEDPALGVVDPNLRVHGVDNLFIAGSSVFPGCGFSNPTFTILALTLRLSDHLRALVT
jgi:choline dehydrogenase-like flavoprotein